MWGTAKYLCENISGAKLAYHQSDEISILITDYDKLNTKAWFDKNIQKMVSISASMATAAFNKAFRENYDKWRYSLPERPSESDNKLCVTYLRALDKMAMFDSRVFVLPKEEVVNCFLWRQQDATRNAIEALGQSYYSQKQLYKKTCNQIQDMLFVEQGINFNDLPVYQKRGACVIKEAYVTERKFPNHLAETEEDKFAPVKRTRWIVDEDIPIFSQDRNYIEQFVNIGEE
jgi:tRNA(His) 5'-end guanylyltransferase